MTEERLPLAELLAKAGDGDYQRGVAEAVVQLLMETDVEGLIGAGRHERSGERLTYRNGYRDRSLDTRLGSLQLRILKLRQVGCATPSLRGEGPAEHARRGAGHLVLSMACGKVQARIPVRSIIAHARPLPNKPGHHRSSWWEFVWRGCSRFRDDGLERLGNLGWRVIEVAGGGADGGPRRSLRGRLLCPKS